MKNFTKENFKQFTSRLSARWLIIALMMLVGTSSAWASTVYFINSLSWTDIKIYYWGNISVDWDKSPSMTKENYQINGSDVYKYTFNNDPQNVIFRGNGVQTVDIAFSAGKQWTPNNQWDNGKAKGSWSTYTPPCTKSVSNGTGRYSNGEITLSAKFNTCGNAYIGFQWKEEGSQWCYENSDACYIALDVQNIQNSTVETTVSKSGGTYVFRPYIVDGSDATKWIYGDDFEVITCSDPSAGYSISNENASVDWDGTEKEVIITTVNGYATPSKIYYEGNETKPTAVGEYTITIDVPSNGTYCAATDLEIGTFTITCPSIAAPDITTSATICAGTQVTLSAYNNSNTVKWYSNSACTAEVTQPVTPTDGTKYYAKAYHAASGCYSSQYSTLTFTVNPLPTISIGDNTNAVKFEDVKLTATGNNIDDVTWIADKGTIIEDATDPKKAVLTYDQTGTVTVTAKAISAAGCESAEVSKKVTFGEEKCSTGKTKIRFRKTYDTNEYYKFYVGGGIYLYAWNSYTNVKYTGEYPGKEVTKTVKVGNYDYYEYEFTESQSTKDLKIIVRATYDWCSNNYCEIGKTRDIALDVPGATYTLELANGDTNKVKQAETEHKKGDSNTNYDVYLFDVNKNSTGGGITITAPAVKTVSVTSDEDGNVTMVGQVVKTGCDTQAILGLQYKKQNPDGTTYEANYTTYPNPGTKEAISAGKTFTVTTKLEDGTYLVRARIDNSHATNGYGEDIKVVVNTTKTPISNVTLNYWDENGGNVGVDPNPMCKGAIAYVKLSYEGSKYSNIKWLVEGVETNLVTDEGDGVWSYEIQGDGSLSVELKNDANTDPAWPYSNKLAFTIIPEPTAPYISIDPASGVICQGSSATIKVENPSTACSYKLVGGGSKADFMPYKSGDLKYTVGSVGKYYVAAKHIACPTNEYTSNQVAINQIISTNANISIDPAKAETTPWEPVTITVKPDAGYIYKLSYTDGNLAAVDGVRIKQNGDSYTYYIPRPDSWGTGNATSARETVNYGIEAQLKVDGEESTCKLKAATAIIQLKDEDNENCPK